MFVGQHIKDWKATRDLIRTVFTNYRIPYLTISPTYSVCPKHGYLPGEHFECPKCRAEKVQALKARLKELEQEKKRSSYEKWEE
jgi:ribonucleoside-triphosphate reductase